VPTHPLDTTVHRLSTEHVPAALRLSTQAGWNQQEEDWRVMISIAPQHTFGATVDGILVGTCIGLDYGGFGWIAMMLVDPAHRRQGLGATLLTRAIGALPRKRPVRLDATPLGRPLYEQHGFNDECLLTRFIAKRANFENGDVETRSLNAVRPMQAADLPALLDGDARVFGGDRQRVLEWALARAPRYCAIATEAGALSGYIFARHGRVFDHIGPVVARSESIARALVRRAAEASTRLVGIDSFDGRPGWDEWLRRCGFAAERPLVLMRREPADGSGARNDSSGTSGSSLHAFAILGPEFG
jgi:GNAT superfamily N-acetyltransferase